MSQRFLMTIAVVGTLLIMPAAATADLIWDVDFLTTGVQEGGDQTWQDGGNANWWNGTGNQAWSNASPTIAQFGEVASSDAYTINVDTFSGVTATGIKLLQRYSLQGGPITLSGTAPVIAMPDAATGTSAVNINSNLNVTDGDIGTADDLVLQGAYPGTTATSYTQIFLYGTNTYSGNMRVENGAVVDIKTAGGLSGTGVVVQAGASLRPGDVGVTSLGAGLTAYLSGYGFGTAGVVHNSRAPLMLRADWLGDIVLEADSTIAAVTLPRTISGVISGNYAMIRTGTQVLTLTNSNTYTGNTETRRGGFDLNSAVGPAINKNGGNLVFRADLSSTAAVVNIQQDEQIGDGAEIQFLCPTTDLQTIDLMGHTETVKGLQKETEATVAAYIQSLHFASAGKLILDTAGSDFTYNGVIRGGTETEQGSMALEKKGLGSQTLAGTCTVDAGTIIKDGALVIDGSYTSNVTVDAAGTLSGAGTITGNVDLNGKLGVAYDGDLDSVDLLTIVGQLDLTGGTISFSNTGSGGLASGDYVLAAYTSILGAPAATEGMQAGWSLIYDYDYNGGTNNSIALHVESGPAIPGDANNSGTVDADDATILAQNWGASGESIGWAQGDFNDDNKVDAADASILAANWGATGEGVGTVPEPGLLLLLTIGLATCMIRRRR